MRIKLNGNSDFDQNGVAGNADLPEGLPICGAYI